MFLLNFFLKMLKLVSIYVVSDQILTWVTDKVFLKNSNSELTPYLKLLNFDICQTGHTSFSSKIFFFSFIEI